MSKETRMFFERRYEAWSIAHPRRWVNATDNQTVAEFVSQQTKKVVEAQLKAADRIVVSQDRIASGIDEVIVELNRVTDGLEGLAAAFDWGFSEMVWQMEQQRELLEEILEVLRAPLDTQAKELRKRAEDAYRNGWIDDALKDFLESEKKNRYDFTIHHYIGNIYLFHKKNPDKALEYYSKAAKYAKPKSPYHASLALLHEGLILYLDEDFEGACEATTTAIELCPELHEAYFQRAQYYAKLGQYDDALEDLQKAIEGDRYYCLKIDVEKDFDVMREKVRSFFKDWRNLAQTEAEEELEKAQEVIEYAESQSLFVFGKSKKFRMAKEELSESAEFLKRASLFDCWDAHDKATFVQELTFDSMEEYLSTEMTKLDEKHDNRTEKLEGVVYGLPIAIALVFVVGLVIIHIIQVIQSFRRDTASGVLNSVCGTIGLVIGLIVGAFLIWLIGHILCSCIWFIVKIVLKDSYKERISQFQAEMSDVKHKRASMQV